MGFSLTLCGRIDLTVEGLAQPSPPLGGKALALLAFLALEHGPHSRDELAALLWGEYPDAKAKASLRQAVAHLRHALGESLRATRTAVELQGPFECDVVNFSRWAKDDPRLAVSVDVPQFLTTLAVHRCAGFDEWIESTRRSLLGRYRELLGALCREGMARGEWNDAIDLADRLLATDPLSKEGVKLALEARYLAGRFEAALTVFASYRERLAIETGQVPTRSVQELVRQIEGEAARRGRGRATEDWYDNTLSFRASLRGRAAEWDALRGAWAAATKGRGQIVLIEGEAGAGKSRLSDDFGRWVISERGTALSGHGHEAEIGVDFGTVVDALQGVIDIPCIAGTDAQWLAQVARIVPGLRRRFPGLPDAPAAEPGDGWRLFEAVTQLLLTLAEEHPVAFIIDDLQWCDAASCSLLHFLARRLQHAPILWCVSLTLGVLERDAPAARLYRALRASPQSSVLRLAPLSDEDVWHMVRELGRVSAPTGARRLAGRIHEVTAGNPFYVIELLKTLFAQGWLTVHPDTGEWVVPPSVSGAGGTPAMAPTVHDAIAERIECLPDDVHAILITIAVSERGCRAEVLSHMHGISRLRAAAYGDSLLERYLVLADGAVFRCAHPVIARVVRDGLSAARRAEVHRSLALALELVGAENPELASPGEISRHAERAGMFAMAYKYALLASQSCVARNAYDEALAWLDTAAATAATPDESRVVDRVTAELLEGAGFLDAPPRIGRLPVRGDEVLKADLDLPGAAVPGAVLSPFTASGAKWESGPQGAQRASPP